MLLVSRSEFVPAEERSVVRPAFSPPASRSRVHESASLRNPPMRSLGPPAYFRAWQRLAPRLPPSATRRPQTFAASRRFIPLRSFQPCFMLVPPMGFSPSEVHSLTIAAHRLSTRASLLDLDPTALDLSRAPSTRGPTELSSRPRHPKASTRSDRRSTEALQAASVEDLCPLDASSTEALSRSSSRAAQPLEVVRRGAPPVIAGLWFERSLESVAEALLSHCCSDAHTSNRAEARPSVKTPTDHLRRMAPKRFSSSSSLESRRRALSSARPKPS